MKFNSVNKLYSFKPKKNKKIQILIGQGTCGNAAGAKKVFDELEKQISLRGLKNVDLKKVGCLGMCFSEPNVEVKIQGLPDILYGRVDREFSAQIIEEHVIGQKKIESHLYDKPDTLQCRIVLRNSGVIDPENIEDYLGHNGYKGLARVLSGLTPDEVIEEIKKSGLRGRGGAGYPVWMKWNFAKNARSDVKYVICNADEGDPGAYMDRSVLEGDPHSVLEGMAIMAYTVGSKKGYVYCRAEYPLAIVRLKQAIKDAKACGLLGCNILGSDFSLDIEIRLGAGAFVCGEETGLIASIEGERGVPRPRPPYPAVKGLFGKPSPINNVETLANIPMILLKGAEWYCSIGTEKSKGTKVFALTGKVKKSGLVEVPMGTTLREIIFDIGGGMLSDEYGFKAAQTGGPSGGVIPYAYLDTPIDYESLQELGSIMGSGGLIVMDQSDCMIDVASFYLQFTIDESCGKCTPCRVGGKQLYLLLEDISKGKAKEKDLELLQSICNTMKQASLCGLGMTAPNPVISTLRHFNDEYLEHIRDKKCRAKKCVALVCFEINPEECIGCTLCVKRCPAHCISGEPKTVHIIDQEKCIKCGECYRVCKFNAVTKL